MTTASPTVKPFNFADNLSKIPSIKPGDNKKSLFLKGEPGTGKTELAIHFPDAFLIHTDPSTDTVTSGMQGDAHLRDAKKVTKWSEFEQWILPAIVNRQLPGESIIIDTWDFLQAALIREIKGTKGMQMQDWGTVLDKASTACLTCVNATQPIGNHPGYNVVFTCHTRSNSDENGNVTSITPHLQGQFKDSIEAYFDVVLICKKDVKSVAQIGAPALKKRVFYLYSVPPSAHETCKSPAYFPPVIEIAAGENGYEKLREVWDRPTIAKR